MNLKRLYSFAIIVGALFAASLFMAQASGSNNNALKAKARNFYLKGAVKEAEGNFDEAYEYYKKAYRLDSGNIDAGYSYGLNRLQIMTDTFTTRRERFRSLALMKSLLDAFPSDVTAGESYAYYAALSDTLPEAIRIYDILVKEHPGLSRLYFPRAFYYAQMGAIDSAVNAMREFERLEGESSETTLRKVSFYLARKDTLAALAEVSAYAARNPGNPAPLLDRAMVYKALNRADSAMLILDSALKEFPDNGDMKFDLALMSVEQGDTARFHQLVAEAFRDGDFGYEERMEMLKIYLQNIPPRRGSYKESDALFEYAYSQYPADATMLDLYANYEVTKEDYPAALDKVKKAYALDPDDPALLGRLISFSILAEKPRVGMEAFEQNTNETEKMQYGIVLPYISAAEMEKEYDKALAAADSLLKSVIPELSVYGDSLGVNPDSLGGAYGTYPLLMASMAFEVTGDIYAKMGSPEEAVKSYEKSLRIPVSNPSVMNNYAYYVVETVKAEPGSELFERAKEMSRKSIDATPDKPQSTYYDTYAWILFKEKNYKEALDYQDVAIELEGDEPSAELLSHYGDILFMNGQPEAAVEQWTKALELQPDNEVLKKKVEHKTFFYE